MHSLFKNLTRKGKKSFNKLSDEEKTDIVHSAVVSKVSAVLAQEVSKSMIIGMELERERLYNEYVSLIDKKDIPKNERKKTIEGLLSYLRTCHLEFVQKRNKSKIDE